MDNLEDVKRQLQEEFVALTGIGWSVHGATFKSPSAIENEDRMVIHAATIRGQSWVLLAVCDGHSGSATSNYVAQRLPKYLRSALKDVIENKLQGCVDHEHLVANADVISKMLQAEIKNLDDDIGFVVRKLFNDVNELTDAEALRLIDEHEEIIERAFQGTSVALALINVDQYLIWSAVLGNSTVALSTRSDEIGVRQAETLCERHALDVPEERDRVTAAHPSEEVIDDQQRLLGLLPLVSRAIGDFHLKYGNAYLYRLFSLLPHTALDGTTLRDHYHKVDTPPYVSNEASVRFMDYGILWERWPILMLYTNGVDQLIDGSRVHNPGIHSGADPASVVSFLLGLSDKVKPVVEGILGHGVERKWNELGSNLNRATEVLGNLLGGTDVERLQAVVTRSPQVGRYQGKHMLALDDTTIILCDLTVLQQELERILA
ncbi:protein serine/threonine phosphatase 2C [Lentinus brumalis]|uniref:Protein serine/threonine phosphatase 2C n=1 Tax=Lentinus brumalis TaxID=2498619 RepID=A0A371DY51_9APHY|nr:protein serine/threonine phosphatase 2C [Polyporus brumalis]